MKTSKTQRKQKKGTGGLVVARFDDQQLVLRVGGEYVVLTFELAAYHGVPQIRVHLAGNRQVVVKRPEILGTDELAEVVVAGFQVNIEEREVSVCDEEAGTWSKRTKRVPVVTRPGGNS